uniref:Uncharacterized protein n=1 Tax=Opuntia streptacantha TaxID=393608 RepID=A0A7C9EJ10_OPUST
MEMLDCFVYFTAAIFFFVFNYYCVSTELSISEELNEKKGGGAQDKAHTNPPTIWILTAEYFIHLRFEPQKQQKENRVSYCSIDFSSSKNGEKVRFQINSRRSSGICSS